MGKAWFDLVYSFIGISTPFGLFNAEIWFICKWLTIIKKREKKKRKRKKKRGEREREREKEWERFGLVRLFNGKSTPGEEKEEKRKRREEEREIEKEREKNIEKGLVYLVWFICLTVYQPLEGYLMPKFDLCVSAWLSSILYCNYLNLSEVFLFCFVLFFYFVFLFCFLGFFWFFWTLIISLGTTKNGFEYLCIILWII